MLYISYQKSTLGSHSPAAAALAVESSSLGSRQVTLLLLPCLLAHLVLVFGPGLMSQFSCQAADKRPRGHLKTLTQAAYATWSHVGLCRVVLNLRAAVNSSHVHHSGLDERAEVDLELQQGWNAAAECEDVNEEMHGPLLQGGIHLYVHSLVAFHICALGHWFIHS